MKIRDSAAVVTGGSRGLGAALGRELASRGARVVLVARGAPGLHSLVDGIRAAGGEAHALVADVADREAAHAIAGGASALVGEIDLLVHNASALGPAPLRLLLDTRDEDFEAVLAANLIGPFRITKAIAGSMALRGRGVIAHVTSDAGAVPYSRWGAYGVSKAGLDHLARIWAEELKDSGVRFLTLDPGEMDTAMHAAAMPEADRSTLARPDDVAREIAVILECAEELASGSRVEVPVWRKVS